MMIQNVEQYKCGGCGKDTYKIYGHRENNSTIFVECIGCGSISKISVATPKLVIDWHEDATGRLSIY